MTPPFTLASYFGTWKLRPTVASLEHSNGAEHLRRA
jgi:hypothetical protein